ncbi:3-deoxy-7-phosphoheptulonate synthase [Patescibacteria group bacterium]|nr:3-deoxy-7-phosphoheptulonate synthase [Patescibacteria group bacterium]
MGNIGNVKIDSFVKLISPNEIRLLIPISEKSEQTITKGRDDFCNVLDGKDDRFVVIVGPCSIHDPRAAMEYANKIKEIINKLGDKLLIMMRVYFEKPRTTTGWKGFINDPYLNETNDVQEGTKLARRLLIDIAKLGVPAATELLDPITAAYVGELVSWVAVGARTTESQTHRQMASGLSAPVGFKNNCDGNLDVAINAMKSAKSQHSFLGVDDEGNCCIIKTNGNPDTHIVLRGGGRRPNYHREDIKECEKKLEAKGFTPKIMIDCSHQNSGKDHTRQKMVIDDVIAQKKQGNKSIFGIMIESNLFEGKQNTPNNIGDLKYGVSITDACIGWEETEKLLHDLYESL